MKVPEPKKLTQPIRIPGLPVPLVERLRRVPKWAWFIIGVGMLPILAVPAITLARFTTSSPAYCAQCHSTGETQVTTSRSLVHPRFDRIGCVSCHAKAGQVVYEGYVKGFMAEPERANPNCIRCHQNVPTTNEQDNFHFNFSDIRIPHKFHFELGATCVTCHSNVAHDFQVPQTNRPRMEACSQCHAASTSCSKCHIKGLPEAHIPIPVSQPVGVPADGRTLYLRQCSGCHGTKGNQIKEHDLSSPETLNTLGQARAFEEVSKGHGLMPSFSAGRGGDLSTEQIKALVAYLWTISRPVESKADAANIYDQQCLVCHGQDGNKLPEARIGSSKFLASIGDKAILDSMHRGKGGMPAFAKAAGGSLDDQQINALLVYLKTLARK